MARPCRSVSDVVVGLSPLVPGRLHTSAHMARRHVWPKKYAEVLLAVLPFYTHALSMSAHPTAAPPGSHCLCPQ
jgi:hypothetical protein